MRKKVLSALVSVVLVAGLWPGAAFSSEVTAGSVEGGGLGVQSDSYQEMYRLYNPNSGEHFYTASAYERDHLVSIGWKDEGVGWLAPAEGVDVYRLYNPNAGDHHYTKSAYERDSLKRVGWRDEGVGWQSADSDGVPLYRQYNPNARAGAHNYTTSKAENDMLAGVGWKAEGVAWYGVPDGGAGQGAVDAERLGKLREYSDGFGITDHQVEYLYQMRGYANRPPWQAIVSDDLELNTLLGSCINDFDGDGALEHLAVLWEGDTVGLWMSEFVDGYNDGWPIAVDQVNVSDLGLTGSLKADVFCDKRNHAIYVEWWRDGNPFASGIALKVARFEYSDNKLKEVGRASVEGSIFPDSHPYKDEIAALGLPTNAIPDGTEFNTWFRGMSLFSEASQNYTKIASLNATVEQDAYDYAEHNSIPVNQQTWITRHLGTFTTRAYSPVFDGRDWIS